MLNTEGELRCRFRCKPSVYAILVRRWSNFRIFKEIPTRKRNHRHVRRHLPVLILICSWAWIILCCTIVYVCSWLKRYWNLPGIQLSRCVGTWSWNIVFFRLPKVRITLSYSKVRDLLSINIYGSISSWSWNVLIAGMIFIALQYFVFLRFMIQTFNIVMIWARINIMYWIWISLLKSYICWPTIYLIILRIILIRSRTLRWCWFWLIFNSHRYAFWIFENNWIVCSWPWTIFVWQPILVSTCYWYFKRLRSYKRIIYIIIIRAWCICCRIMLSVISIAKWNLIYVIYKTLKVIFKSWSFFSNFLFITTFYWYLRLIILVFKIGLIMARTRCIICYFLLISRFNSYWSVWCSDIYIILIRPRCDFLFSFSVFYSHISTFNDLLFSIFDMILVGSGSSFFLFFIVFLEYC